MKKKIILPIIAGIAVLALSSSTVVNQNGTYGWTGSPVDGGTGSAGTCLNCHNSSGTAPTLAVTTSPALGTGNTYIPNQTYTVTITVTGSQPKYGINCEIINSQSTSTSAVSMFGTFGAVVTPNIQIYTTTTTTPYPPCVSHNAPSASGVFSFKWTAPASGTGYLYAIGLGANGDGTNTGDHQSATASMTLTPSSTGIATHYENEVGLQVFPNPATDNMRITYMLAERSNVNIKLCNINGEVVADLMNESQDRGVQSVDARLPIGLAKGMYMVKLSINGKLTTQKLMVF